MAIGKSIAQTDNSEDKNPYKEHKTYQNKL